MRNHIRPLLLVPILLSAAACSTAPSATQSTPPPVTGTAFTAGSEGASVVSSGRLSGDATQTSDAAGVTIAVTWAGPSAGAVFAVQMDNHMIDLASVDLSKAILSNDRSERLSEPTVQGGSSGHHRTDTLTFATATPGFFAGASWIQLELPAVGDTTLRDFKWNLTK
jgi:hypothetical protein